MEESILGTLSPESILLNHEAILFPQQEWSHSMDSLWAPEPGQMQKGSLLFEVTRILRNGWYEAQD